MISLHIILSHHCKLNAFVKFLFARRCMPHSLTRGAHINYGILQWVFHSVKWAQQKKIKVLSGWNGNFCGRVIWLCVCTVFLSLSILDKKEELFNIIFHTHESTQWNDFFLFSFPLLRLRRYVCGVLSVNNNNCCAFFQPNGFPESERDWSSYMELYSVVSSHSFICLCLSFFLFAILDRARHERRVPMRVLEGIISINV